jgi:hypothetical protein
MAKRKIKTQGVPQGKELSADYGSICHLVYSMDKDAIEYNSISEMVEAVVKHCGAGAHIAAESSLGSYRFKDYNNALRIAEEGGVTLGTINPNQTKNCRSDLGDIIKTNENDAKVIWLIAYDTVTMPYRYHQGEFKPRDPITGKFLIKEEDRARHNLHVAIAMEIKARIRDARYKKYKDQHPWLKKHKFPTNAAYSQMLIVAEVCFGHGRRVFDKMMGLYGRAKGSIQRASVMHDLLPAMIRKATALVPRKSDGKMAADITNRPVRKGCLKIIRPTSRKAFGIRSKELREEALLGTGEPEMGTSRPAESLPL